MPIDRAWLSMTLKETSPGITGLCEHKNELLNPAAALDWVGDYKKFLARAATNPDTQLGRLADF